MKIREADINDSIEITKMYRNLYEEEFSMDSLIPIDKNQFISKVFLAQEKNEVVGFIWINFIEYGVSKYGYIEELFVKALFRNKGYGSSLVHQAKDFLLKKSVQAIFVSISSNSKNNRTFYQKQDFHECEGFWFYFTDQSGDKGE